MVGFVSVFFWGLYKLGDRSDNQDFNQEIGSLIDQGFSWILTCWDIAWEIDRKIMLVKELVLVASPLGYNWGVVAIQIDTTVESISPS